MISMVGAKTIKNNKVKFNVKNCTVMGVILFLGLYGTYFQKYTGINISIPITESVSIGGLSLAALVGVILNIVLESVFRTPEVDRIEI